MSKQVSVPTNPVGGPAAWMGSKIQTCADWIFHLNESDILELEHAFENARAQGKTIFDITKTDFPLHVLGEKLVSIRFELEHGPGLKLIRGLPVTKWGEDKSTAIYWGIGQYLGEPVAQNMMGELLGHVQAAGLENWNENHKVRGYQTTVHLPFHCDKSDVVGLLCLQVAKSGGTSNISSAVTIHDQILRTRPDLLAALYEQFAIDHRGEEFPGEAPFYMAPTFAMHKGRFFSRFGMKYVESAQRYEQVDPLSPLQIEAMAYFNQLASRDDIRLDMEFKPGDIQFLNNHLMVHSRTDYKDWPEPELRRHLIRMLLFTPSYCDQNIPPEFAELNCFIRRWGAEPRVSVLANSWGKTSSQERS